MFYFDEDHMENGFDAPEVSDHEEENRIKKDQRAQQSQLGSGQPDHQRVPAVNGRPQKGKGWPRISDSGSTTTTTSSTGSYCGGRLSPESTPRRSPSRRGARFEVGHRDSEQFRTIGGDFDDLEELNSESEEQPAELVPLGMRSLSLSGCRNHRRRKTRTNFHDFYKLTDDHLGSGAYASVQTGISIATGKEFAVKLVDKHEQGHTRSRIMREVDTFNMCINHPNIVQLHEWFEDHDYFYLVFEKMRGGPLLNHIQQKGFFTEQEASKVTRDIANALKYLHDRGIAHRDVKPENVLCSDFDRVSPVKLCDLDLASKAVPQSPPKLQSVNSEPDLASPVGSAEFMAPEVVDAFVGDALKYDKRCDMWSLGVIVYIMLCGYPPFYGQCWRENCGWDQGLPCNECQENLFKRIQLGEFDFPEPEWETVSEEAKDLICHLLVKNVRERYTADEVLKHPWVRNGAPETKLQTPGNLFRNDSARDMHQMQEHFNVMNRIVAARLSACLEKRKGSITEEDAVNHRKYSLAIGDELRKLNERNNNDNAEDDLMMRRFDKSIPAVITAKPPNGLVKTAVDAIAAAQLPLSTPLSVITAAPPASSAPVVVMAAGTQAPTLLQPYVTSSLVAAGNSAMPFQAAAAVLNVSDAPTIANNLALAVPTVVPASEATSAKVEAVIKEQKVDLDYSVRVPMVAEHAKKMTDGGCLNEKERTKDDMTKMDLTQAALSPKQIGGNASSEASETTHVGEETKTVKTLETVARQALNSIPAATVTPMATLTNTTPNDGRIAQSGSVEAVDELWKRSAALPTTPLKSAAAPIIVAPAAPVVAGNGPISNNSYRNSSQENNNSTKMVTTTTKNRVHNTNSNSGRRGQQQQQQQQAISLMNAMNLSQNMDLSQQQQNMIMHQNQAQNQILMVTAAAPPTYHHPQQQQQHGGGGGHAQAHVSHQHHQQQLQQMIQQQHASANAPQPMPVHVSQMATLPNGLAFGGGAGGLAQLNGTIQFQQHPANNQLIAMNPPTTAAPPPPNGTIYHPQMYPQHLLPQPLYPPQHFANAAAAQQHQLYKLGIVPPQQFMMALPPQQKAPPAATLYEQRSSMCYGMLGKRSQQQQQQAGGGGVVGKANNAGGGYYRETVTPPACFTVGACNSYNKTMMTGMSNSAHTTPQKMSNHNRNHNHHNNHHHRNHNNNNNRMLTVRSAAALNIQPVVSAQQLDQLETCQTAMARQDSNGELRAQARETQVNV